MKKKWIGKYEYLDDFNLVLEHHSGDFTLNDIIPFRMNLLKNNHILEDADFLVDLRDSTPFFSYDQLADYLQSNSSFQLLNSERKVAVLTDTPAQVAFVTLIKQNVEHKKGVIEIFSTTERALNWLNCSIPSEALEELLSTINSPKHNSQ